MQARSHFPGMSRVHAAIVFTGQHQHGWVIGPGQHMMVRRVGIERLKLIGVVHRAEFRHVKCAIRVEFHAEHIVNADMRYDSLHQAGVLSEGGAHEQTPIAPAFNGQFRGLGVI